MVNMHKRYDNLDNRIGTLRHWAKSHKTLAILASFFILILCWPLLITFLVVSLIRKKVHFKFATTSMAAILVMTGLIANVGWVYGLAKPKPLEQKKTTNVSITSVSTPPKEQLKQKEVVNVELYQVVQVVDGDTIKVNMNGKTETIRLIGVDTPETVDPRKTVQCFGEEASKFAKESLSGQSVKLEADATQDNRDKYNRLLRYVFLSDGTNFNQRLVSEGYAYEYTYNTAYSKQAEFKSAQKVAESSDKGLWAPSTCDGQKTKAQAVSPSPVPAPSVTPPPTPAPSPAPSEGAGCDPNYTPCVPISSADLDCGDIGFMVRVIGTDRHRFDANHDGYGCESYR